MTEQPQHEQLSKQTRQIYERNAQAFDAQRPKGLHERKWLDKFLAFVPQDGAILDVGCGAGEPFVPYFIRRGFMVEGCDVASNMLAIVRNRFPNNVWHHADMRTMDLGNRYDGILAWNSFFHLTQEDQYLALDRFAAHLNTNGALMLTVGPEAGVAIGHVNGEEVYHASLSNIGYINALRNLGLEIVEFVNEDPECDLHTIILAQKTS